MGPSCLLVEIAFLVAFRQLGQLLATMAAHGSYGLALSLDTSHVTGDESGCVMVEGTTGRLVRYPMVKACDLLALCLDSRRCLR